MTTRSTIYGLLLTLTFALSACGGAPAASEPTSAPAAQPSAAPAAQPTAVFEAVTDNSAEPTVGVAQADVSGTLAWRDQVLRNDAVAIAISGLGSLPTGEVYAAWLATKESSLPLGPLTTGENGTVGLAFASPAQQNLLGSYERIYITKGPLADATSKPSAVVLGGFLPEQALVAIRRVLFSAEPTPNQIGFALGLRQESDELLRHAQFLRDAYEANDFALERVHGEHIINIIRGSEARDANGDGNAQNPGDGYGLLPNGQQDGYIKGMVDQAKLAAAAPDATEAIKLHAGHVQITGENTRQRVDQLRGLAEQVVAAPDRAATQQYVLAILTLAEQTIQGVDANLDEQVGPIAGEGGVITAYQHAQLMASMALTAQDSAAVVPTAAAVAGAPTAAVVAGAPTALPAPGATIVDIGDNTFNQQEISVPVGATVMWMSSGQKPHTVTVDDGSFKSATLKNGDMFTHTFDKPGVYAYYCEFHGSAGGQGMAGVIRVGDVASAPEQAPAAPAAAPLTVSMKDFAFEATELKVRVGQSVLWKNDGEKPHSATAVDGSFDTGLYGAGESKTVQFNQAGTFLYFCQLHGSQDGTSGMVGTIIVEP